MYELTDWTRHSAQHYIIFTVDLYNNTFIAVISWTNNISGSVALLTNMWLLDGKWRVIHHAPNHVRQALSLLLWLTELSSPPLDTVNRISSGQTDLVLICFVTFGVPKHTHTHTHTHWLTSGFGTLSSLKKILVCGDFGVRFYLCVRLGVRI